MLLLGATVPGRYTEQHDVFFSIATNLAELAPPILAFWPEVNKVHIDAWREVNRVDEFNVKIVDKTKASDNTNQPRLFFINLGGYKEKEFDEFHYKILVAASSKGEAIEKAKQTAFYKHMGFDGANSHIDDKYGVDVDDLFEIADILSPQLKEQYTIELTPATNGEPDKIHLGYFKLDRLQNLV